MKQFLFYWVLFFVFWNLGAAIGSAWNEEYSVAVWAFNAFMWSGFSLLVLRDLSRYETH